MAFQTGTQVRPELGRADVSGFARAGMITGQALANLGAQVGGAIAANKEKKANAQLSKAATGLLFKMAQSNPEGAAGLGIETMEDAAVAVNVIGAKNAMELLSQMGQVEQPTASEIRGVAQLMERPEFEGIKFDETTGEAYMEVPNKETLRPFDKKRVPVPEQVAALPGFAQYAQMQRTTSKPRDFEAMGMRVVE
jgi:hypothetical protein